MTLIFCSLSHGVIKIYNAAYELNLSEGRIHQAVNNARSMDPSTGKIRNQCCKALFNIGCPRFQDQ
jgi:hypothetical protein